MFLDELPEFNKSSLEVLRGPIEDGEVTISRVNATLSSCDKFYETYDVREGDGMYVAPEKRVERW